MMSQKEPKPIPLTTPGQPERNEEPARRPMPLVRPDKKSNEQE